MGDEKWPFRLLERDVATGYEGEDLHGQCTSKVTIKRVRVTTIAVINRQ